MGKKSFFTSKAFARVLNYLKENKEEVPAFLEELAPQLKEDPSKYISFVTKLVTPKEKYKFVPDEEDKNKWIQNMDIKTILDVGAWKGDSARSFHELFPRAVIYSFEPLHDCYNQLQKLESSITNLKTFNFALGDKTEKMKINRSGFTPSSSLLKMNQLHKDAFPFTAEETVEEIEVRTLDSFLNEINFVDNVLLKIDVQGFEENVLNGALQTLKKVKIIIVELTFVKLYEGQPMFGRIYDFLTEKGFIYSGSWHQLLNPNDGTICQQNGIFINGNNS